MSHNWTGCSCAADLNYTQKTDSWGKRWGIKSIIVLFVFAVFMALPGAVVWAATLESPEDVAIAHVNVFRDLAEDGDLCIFFEGTISFPSDNYPSEAPASESVILRLA